MRGLTLTGEDGIQKHKKPEVEAIGGNILASASREQMGYTFDALKTYVPEMVELLVDSVRNPVFLDWEVNEEVIFFS